MGGLLEAAAWGQSLHLLCSVGQLVIRSCKVQGLSQSREMFLASCSKGWLPKNLL